MPEDADQIGELIRSYTELKNYFEKVRDEIEADRKALAARLDRELQPICGTWFYGGPQEGSIEITEENTIVRWLSESANTDASCFSWLNGQPYISVERSGHYLIAVNVSLANTHDIAVMAELVQRTEESAEERIGYAIVHSHVGDVTGYATGSFTVVKKIEEHSEIALKISPRTLGKTIRLHDGTFISIIRLSHDAE